MTEPTLKDAAIAFLKKFDELEPAIDNAFFMEHIRGRPYKGETLEAELNALRRAASSQSEPLEKSDFVEIVDKIEGLKPAPDVALIDQALDDWMVTYADTESGKEEQLAAYRRMRDAGGTLAYIAKARIALSKLTSTDAAVFKVLYDDAEDQCTKLSADISALSKRWEWISVADRLPKPHTHVWCRNRDGTQFEGCICYGMHTPFFTYPRGDGSPSNTAPAWIDVTHWMDLPADPRNE